ncbi:MAG TPA: hypothetical protein VHV82_00335 [Sporichthyaceae bacterium]|nr:hypothetical protein [Sporichthyaceae bacterium]
MEMTLSKFVQMPTSGLKPLDAGEDVVLTRRDGEDLLVRRARDVRRSEDSLAHLANVVARIAAVEIQEPTLAALRDEFPWLGLLSDDEVVAFANEYLSVARACAAVANFTQLEIVTQAWRSTAQMAGDPELRALVASRLGEQPLVAPDPRRTPAAPRR